MSSDNEVEFVDEVEAEIAKLDYQPEINQPTSKKRDNLKRKMRNDILRTNRYEFESGLLDAVFDRPALFDYTLPIKDRSPSILAALWQEVCDELKKKFEDINIGIDFIKDMYKTLRNNYTRYKSLLQKEQTSGSCSKMVPEPKHSQKLRRLDSVLVKRA